MVLITVKLACRCHVDFTEAWRERRAPISRLRPRKILGNSGRYIGSTGSRHSNVTIQRVPRVRTATDTGRHLHMNSLLSRCSMLSPLFLVLFVQKAQAQNVEPPPPQTPASPEPAPAPP